MGESNVSLNFTAEMTNAARGWAEMIRLEKEFDSGLKGIATHSAAASRAMADHMGQTTSGIKQAASQMDQFTGSVKNWIGSFVGIGTAVAAVKAIAAEMEKTRQLQKEMMGVSLSNEQLALKIANLPGRRDVSKEGLGKVNSLINQVALSGGVSQQTASNILFYSESAMGSNASALSAATQIAQFAGPAGLTPQEVRQIPKLFNLTGADTAAKQQQVMAKIYQAAGGSIASTGEYLEPFIGQATNFMSRGFTLDESLARMSSAVDVTGSVADAGSMSERLAAITSGRNAKALKYLERAAKKQGKDFRAMSDPQRMAMVEGLWDTADAAGMRDVFKEELDSRGYEAMLRLFSPQGKKKYTESLAAISAANPADLVSMTGQFKGTLMSSAAKGEVKTSVLEGTIGDQTASIVKFNKAIDEVQRIAHARSDSLGDFASMALLPSGMEKNMIADILVRGNLKAAMEKEKAAAGESERYGRLGGLLGDYTKGGPGTLSLNPKLAGQIYSETGGLTEMTQWQPTDAAGQQNYPQGVGPVQSAVKSWIDMADKMDKSTEAIERLTQALERQRQPGQFVEN
jgi:hypothetical protein